MGKDHSMVVLRFSLVLILISGVQAAKDDDVANNLFSDLAPLLALFGEQYARQFMSESMTWVDHIVFAMAPLGIITALTGAIRVGGPSWLKAVIGRARENISGTEVELMSSTSHDVCELWNGQAVIRTVGKSQIQELVFLEGCGDERDFGLYTLEEAKAKGFLQDNDHRGPLVALFHKLRSFFHRPAAGPRRLPAGAIQERGLPLGIDCGARQQRQCEAPNLSLNIHGGSSSADLLFAAVCGIALQAGVVTFTAFTVYDDQFKSRFKKGGKPIQAYAFPVMASGTILLVSGMLLCSFIIEHSTTERVWTGQLEKPFGGRSVKRDSSQHDTEKGRVEAGPRRADDVNCRPIRIFWLQQNHVVNDQSFNSYVLFAKGERKRVLTSRRLQDPALLIRCDQGAGNTDVKLAESISQNTGLLQSLAALQIKLLSILGVILGALGFILQFEGFRALNWTASVAQLSATVLMTVLRAWVRRWMISKPNAQGVLDQHEMDWVALGLALDPDFWRKYSDDSAEGTRHGLYSAQSKDSDKNSLKSQAFQDDNQPQSETFWWTITTVANNQADRGSLDLIPKQPLSGCNIIRARQRLGHLTQWTSPVFRAAVSTAMAIEDVMNTFFGPTLDQSDKVPSSFTWYLSANHHSHHRQVPENERVIFTLSRNKKGWETDTGLIEAALSLWLYHIRTIERSRKYTKAGEKGSSVRRRSGGREESNHHKGNQSIQRYRQILGPYTERLRRDLQWFLGDGIAEDRGTTISNTDLLIGFCGLKPRAATLDNDFKTSMETPLVTTSSATLELFLAQHIFSAFMWAVAEYIPDEKIGGSTTIDNKYTFNLNDAATWRYSKLENTVITKLARDIQRSGLGSLEEALMCIIPPLSCEQKLPVEAMVDFIRQNLKPHEVHDHWREAEQAHMQLLRFGTSVESTDRFVFKALAAVTEFLMSATVKLLGDKPHALEQEAETLQHVKDEIEQELAKLGRPDTMANVRTIYRMQSRLQDCRDIFKALEEGPITAHTSSEELCKLFRHTPLHQKIIGCNGGERSQDETDFNEADWESLRKYINSKDIVDWTPLHYAVIDTAKTCGMAKHMLELGANPNAKDVAERTPLHYAALRGNQELARSLLLCSAEVGAQGRDGMQPLHCAAKLGNLSMAKLLLQERAQLNAQDNLGRTPLHYASYNGHLHVVKLLIEEGASSSIGDHYGRKPLHLATVNKHLAVMRVLLKRSSSVKERDRDNRTSLHDAVLVQCKEAVRLLLQCGAKIDAPDIRGRTAFALATRPEWRDWDIARLLRDWNADVNTRDDKGEAPLYWTAASGDLDMVKYLLQQGANPSVTTNFEWAPLHWSACNGHREVVEALLESGADVNTVSDVGETPLDETHDPEMRQILLSYGAKTGAEVAESTATSTA